MPDNRPNILLVFTDQQRADTLGTLNPVMRTPTMDRLCAEGTTFTRAYTPVPVCVPARCSLIFGQYAHKTDCYENGSSMPAVTPERPTFMSALSEAGYQAHGVGKMHFTPDRMALRGFESRDYSEEGIRGPDTDDYLATLHANGYQHVHDANGVRGEMYYIPQPSQLPARLHNSHWVADRSLQFLEQRDRSRPFLLMTSFIDPHPPFAPPVPWNKLYRAPSMPLPLRPPDARNFWTFINRRQNRYKFRDAGIDDRLMQVMKAYYYATVSFIDYNVGRIVQAMEQSGELENTLILWTSDHGEFLGDYDCFGKRTFLRSTANVPLIARFPERFPSGKRVDAPASLVDVMPTFLAAAGVESPSHLDGVDLAALTADPSKREVVWGQYASGNQASYMALTDRFKYIYCASDDREFLFDTLVDPLETRNRAETLGSQQHTQTLRQATIDHLRQDGYADPLDGDDWRRCPPPKFPRDPDAGLLFQDAPWSRELMYIPGYSDKAMTDDGRRTTD
jgi:arylsulfatase A-like enzyme